MSGPLLCAMTWISGMLVVGGQALVHPCVGFPFARPGPPSGSRPSIEQMSKNR